MNKQTLEDKFAKLEAELDTLKEQITNMLTDEWKPWVPEIGDYYYCYWRIDALGEVRQSCWTGNESSHARLAIGNVFRTEQEAQDRVNHMKALTKLRSLAKGFVPDWVDAGQGKWFPMYNSEEWIIGCTQILLYSTLPYFATKEDAQAAIEAMGDQMDDLLKGGW